MAAGAAAPVGEPCPAFGQTGIGLGDAQKVGDGLKCFEWCTARFEDS